MTTTASTGAGAGDGPVVLITGASSGIGRAAARRFASRGWRVFASMRHPERGESLLAEAKDRGWDLHVPTLDVTDDGSVARAVAAMLATTGGRDARTIRSSAPRPGLTRRT